ncbi:DEAD/DEAH box helicase family protein [Belnapia arida]|uniref:DEAD/DEAH box helicase family protein n=1 Tax=Belnapia arida TaxID=2804533 RepID=UPI0038B3CC1D
MNGLTEESSNVQDDNIAAARRQLNDYIRRVVHDAVFCVPSEGLPAPARIAAAPPGLGKTGLALRASASVLHELRARGDGRTVAVAVPTVALAEQIAARFNALQEARGLNTAIWRGRDAADPERRGEHMCLDPEAASDAFTAGLPIGTSVCRRAGRGGGECIHAQLCGYQRQRRLDADLWVVTHPLITTPVPRAIGKPALLVVDEMFWPAGLKGSGTGPLLPLKALEVPVPPSSALKASSAARLVELQTNLARAIETMPEGPLRRDACLAAGVNHAAMAEGHRLAVLRLSDANPLRPGMAAQTRRAALRTAGDIRAVALIAQAFSAIAALVGGRGPVASGWAALAGTGPTRQLCLSLRREIAPGWRVPTLLLDAVADPVLNRAYWPSLADGDQTSGPPAPHMRVVQLADRDWAKTALVPDGWCSEAETARRLRNSLVVRALVLRESYGVDGRVLAIVPKVVEAHWRSWPVPANLELAHHNSVTGRDDWGPSQGGDGIRLLIIVGRTLPAPFAAERMAEILMGAAVSVRVRRYERESAVITLRDGSTSATTADRHPDPIAERIRRQLCEHQLIQLIGRGRGVNRTAANPLSVLLLTNRPIGEPVDAVTTWSEIAPSAADMMLATSGIAIGNAVDAAQAYSLWPSAAAARQAFRRCRTHPIEDLKLWGCRRALNTGSYQLAGPGRRAVNVVFDPKIVADPEAWLTWRLGLLSKFSLVPPVFESPATGGPVL